MIDLIRAKYPSPISIEQALWEDDEYCVGGAFCKYINFSLEDDEGFSWEDPEDRGREGFPNEEQLAEALQSVNRSLNHRDAREYAEAINEQSDEENFEVAWSLLAEALSAKGADKPTT